ncbi:MAG: hypothetical protein AMXMBFR34_53670 [Myxococcaceae bacterium]
MQAERLSAAVRACYALAAADLIGGFPSNRFGSGDRSECGKVFGTDARALEAVGLVGTPEGFDVYRRFELEPKVEDPVVQVGHDEWTALGGSLDRRVIRLKWVKWSPFVVARHLGPPIFKRGAAMLNVDAKLVPVAIAHTMAWALKQRYPGRNYEVVDGPAVAQVRTGVSRVTDSEREFDVRDHHGTQAGDELLFEVQGDDFVEGHGALMCALEPASVPLDGITCAELWARRSLDRTPMLKGPLPQATRALYDGGEAGVVRVTAKRKQIYDTWATLKAPGWTPVLIGDDRAVEGVAQGFAKYRTETVPGLRSGRHPGKTPDEILAQAEKIEIGPLPECTGPEVVEPPIDGGGAPTTHLALVPVAEPWKVPAYLPFFTESGQDTPSPAELTAMLRKLYSVCGATVVSLDTTSTIRVHVRRLPRPGAEALSLAKELVAFCGDAPATNNARSLEDYARFLSTNHLWSFWWD